MDTVRFEGVDEVSKSDLSGKIATTPTPKFLGLFRGLVYDYAIYDPYVLAQDVARVERYYRAQGYYQAHARAARVEYVAEDHVRVTIAVEEGPPVVVRAIRVDGISGLSEQARQAVAHALARSGLVVGDRFVEDTFAGAEWHIRRALENQSYAFVKVERRAEVDLPTHSVTVAYVVTPGCPATLGPIIVRGLEGLPEAPVLRALGLRPGQPYSARAIDDAQQAILDLGVFSAVAVVPERSDPPPADRTVPITVNVAPTKLRSIQVGGGIELDTIQTNLHARIGWTDRNFLGGLRKFDVDFRPGVVLYPTRLPDFQSPDRLLPEERTRVSLRQPALFDGRTSGYLRGDFNVYPLLVTPNVDPNAPVVGYAEAHAAVGADRTLRKLYANLSYNAQYEYPFAYIPSRPIDPRLQSVVISYLDLQTNIDLRDDRVTPRKGLFVGNEAQFAGLGGNAVDFRIQPQVRGYLPVRHSTLALRATTGLLFPLNYGPPDPLHPTDRDVQLSYFRGFFSGGASSNRGYPIWGVGPHGIVPFLTPALATQAAQNECIPGTTTYNRYRCSLPLGGETLWEASAELRVPLTPALEDVTFCDASDVESGQFQYDFSLHYWHLSCGIGLRYGTPAGPIRLDVGYRIPGFQPTPGQRNYYDPGTVFGLPIAISIGIGEAF